MNSLRSSLLWRLAADFRRNQGLLLAGAVAYYTPTLITGGLEAVGQGSISG